MPEVADHSGIYVGDGKIVALSSSGKVVCERPGQFRDAGRLTITNIYISCRDKKPVGKESVAKRAERKVGDQRDYDFISDNCHEFSSGCLTGKFNNEVILLKQLKNEAKSVLGCDSWRPWDTLGHARSRQERIQRFCEEIIPQLRADRDRLQSLLEEDFARRGGQLDNAFADMMEARDGEDFDGFVQALGRVNEMYGKALPWQDFEDFDDWMLDDSTVLEL